MLSNVNICAFTRVQVLFHLFDSLLVGYAAIAINTTIGEDILVHTKKKGNKKNEQIEEKKDIPPPPILNFTEEDLNSLKVTRFTQDLKPLICLPNRNAYNSNRFMEKMSRSYID